MDNIVYKKKDSLEKLKFFTNLLFDKNYSIDKIKKFEDDPDFINFKYRIINYVIGYPKLLNYINTYFNNYLNFNMPSYEWYDSLRLILNIFGISNTSFLKFTKFKIPERKRIKSIISERYEYLSDRDLNELYRLYTINIINNDHLNSLKISEKIIKQKTNLFDKINEKKQIEKQPEPQSDLNSIIHQLLEKNPTCTKCSFYKKDKLFIEGNIKKFNEIQILFINDFSTNKEFKNNKIFFDNETIKKIDKYKYAVINLIPCNIDNEVSLFKKKVNDCKNLINPIIESIKQKKCITALIGNRVREFYNIKIKDNSKFINEKYNNYFILPSPDENYEKYVEGIDKIASILKSDYEYLDNYVNEIEKNNENLLLFDIKIIKNKILYIFYNKLNSEKKYYVEDVKFPIFIKTGEYRTCDYIENKFEKFALLSVFEKSKLMNYFLKNLQQIVKLEN